MAPIQKFRILIHLYYNRYYMAYLYIIYFVKILFTISKFSKLKIHERGDKGEYQEVFV